MKTILVSVGDPSAQLHAVKLARRFKKKNCAVASIGGSSLKDVSDTFLADTIALETFGFSTSLISILKLYRIFRVAKRYMERFRPDGVLLVDFYGFNIKLAAAARALSIPVFYYIPPQVWASRYSRIRKIKKNVDKVFLTLPFEKQIYDREGISYEYVGHPLLEDGAQRMAITQTEGKKIGFFPGSRSHVIKKHIPIINQTAQILKEKSPKSEFYLFGLKSLSESYREVSKDVRVVYEDNSEVIKDDMELAVSVSGTVATELALREIPTVIFYKVNRVNAFLIKKIIRTSFVSLPNLMLNEAVFPEYLQDSAAPAAISQKIIEYLENPPLVEVVKEKLKRIKEMLKPSDASDRVVESILNIIERHSLVDDNHCRSDLRVSIN